MTSRILPRDEWHRLEGTELESVCADLPDGTAIVVVEQDAEIVGHWAAIPYVHMECLWIHKDHRGRSRVGAYLLRAMRSLTESLGLNVVLTAAVTDDVRSLITHAGGVKLPGDHYAMPTHLRRVS